MYRRTSQLVITVLLTFGILIPFGVAPRSARAATDSHVQVVNLADTDFWVGWLTDVPTTGKVYYGTTCAQAQSESNASSIDLNYGSTAHLVDVGSGQLTAGQTYYYIIVDDDGTVDTNGGSCYTATMLEQAANTNGNDLMAGTIMTGSGCAAPGAQALIVVTITHNGITSLPLGTTAYADGTWQLPTSYALNPDGTATNPQNGDMVTLTASLAPDQIETETFSYNMDSTDTQQVPVLCVPGVTTVSVSPDPVSAGASLSISGHGYPSNARLYILLTVTNSWGSSETASTSTTATSSGTIPTNTAMIVPSDAAAGKYSLAVYEGTSASGTNLAVTSVTVTVPASIGLTPATGQAGVMNSVTVSGQGFGQYETVVLSYAATVTMGETQTIASRTTANSYGAFKDVSLSVPSTIIPGNYSITAQGLSSGIKGTAALQVTGPLFSVGTTSDPSSCPSQPATQSPLSLRCAISAANAAGSGYIRFAIPSTDSGCVSVGSGGPPRCTIRPTSGLPAISASHVTIDGYTQQGTRPSTSLAADSAVIAVLIDGRLASASADGLQITGSYDTVAGIDAENFGSNGITIDGGTGNIIEGNFIGTDPTGTTATPNAVGVFIQASSGNTIGGSTPGAANLLSGNRLDGVSIDGDPLLGSADTNLIQGNLIGTDATGTHALGNGVYGVFAYYNASGDVIGGTQLGAGNTIAYNGSSGIEIGASPADNGSHVAVTQNAIFNNGRLGIDLTPVGTVNCTTAPPGPNDYVPCPIITSADPTHVSGTACPTCTVEVYTATNETDDKGYGEGKTYLGTTVADGSGKWNLTLAAGQISTTSPPPLTADATAPATAGHSAETSEFGLNAVSDPVAINSGWNLLDVPLTNTGIGSFSSLLTSLDASLGGGSIKVLAAYTNGRYTLFVPGYASDHALNKPSGIFALSASSGTWDSFGQFYTNSNNPGITLQPGWNLVAAPYPASGLDASTINSEIGSACGLQEIATYGSTGYTVWTPGSTTSLHIPSTSGFWIECTKGTSWTPS